LASRVKLVPGVNMGTRVKLVPGVKRVPGVMLATGMQLAPTSVGPEGEDGPRSKECRYLVECVYT
jgi:hypothetical protein